MSSILIISFTLEVIYDDEVTDAFMSCVIHINYSRLKEPVDVYVAIEKRYVIEHGYIIHTINK